MVRLPHRPDPLLARPFALYDTVLNDHAEVVGLDFVYHVVGKATAILETISPGDELELWGPLGNGFPAATGGRLLCLGGGIGYTPFLAVARESLGQRTYGVADRGPIPPTTVTLCYGVRSQPDLADLADFQNLGPGLDIRLATDDGTVGHHGYVTQLLQQILRNEQRPTAVYVCGPEPMMRSAAEICQSADLPCWISLETPMACGFGACFSCVTKVHTATPPGWDYRRTCIEGPVFPSKTLVW